MAAQSSSSESCLAALHLRVCNGDAAAREELVAAALRSLPRGIRIGDRDAATEAVVDAILEYLSRPGRFDPDRGVPLERYLHLAAMRNLQNHHRSELRRHARERLYAQEHARLAALQARDAAPPPQ
jgi:hypothetical protein